MIYVSHAIDEILYLTTQIILLDQGKLIAQGDFHRMMRNSQVQATAKSMGLDNVLRATVVKHYPQHGYTELKQGNQPIIAPLIHQACNDMVTISIAANQIILSINAIPTITAENQLVGRVVSIEPINQHVIVSVDMGDAAVENVATDIAAIGVTALYSNVLKVELSDYALQASGIVLGASVCCLIKAQAIHVHGVV